MPWTVDFSENPKRPAADIGICRFTWTGDGDAIVFREDLNLAKAETDQAYRDRIKAKLEAARDETIAKRAREVATEGRFATFLNS